jgi:DNA-binding NarL/FixJ family response regulator
MRSADRQWDPGSASDSNRQTQTTALFISSLPGRRSRRASDAEELADAVRRVAEGECVLDPTIVARLMARQRDRGPLTQLTDREREVLVLVAEGLSNDEIAARLVISPATAKTHVSRTMVKLGARDRAQLVVYAYEAGLIRPGWLT